MILHVCNIAVIRLRDDVQTALLQDSDTLLVACRNLGPTYCAAQMLRKLTRIERSNEPRRTPKDLKRYVSLLEQTQIHTPPATPSPTPSHQDVHSLYIYIYRGVCLTGFVRLFNPPKIQSVGTIWTKSYCPGFSAVPAY